MLALVLTLAITPQEASGARPRVLFFTHSAGFVHDVVRRPAPNVLATAEQVFARIAGERYAVACSQDCADLAPARLAELEALVFMTTGELPLASEARAALIEWVARGGAFVGVHCAADTWYEFAPFLEMLGGTFDGHPWHEPVGLRVEDPRSPATAALPATFELEDEIYQFRAFRRHPLEVVLALEPSSVELALGKRADGDYALAWCKPYGEGRVFYTALGHREEVWNDARFQLHLLGGLAWALDGPDLPARAPLGARVLLDATPRDGGALDAWRRHDGGAPAWRVVEGGLEVVPGSGSLVTREALGDGLYHVEFWLPALPEAEGQARANSGVYVQARYELQVLDSHGLVSRVDDCAALYGVRAPSVNACRRPERWQSYDIEFRAPRFDAQGKKTEAARVTAWHNGRLVHADVELAGPTRGGLADEAARGPLLLQDHGDRVRYRNVWVLPRE